MSEDKLAKARKEGQIVIYASLRGVLMSLVTAFRRFYRHETIHVSFFSSHPQPIYERIKAEIEAGIPTADVVILPQYMILQLQKEGLLREYESEEFKAYPAEFYDSSGGWCAMAVEPTGIVYNPTVFREEELPTTLEEFLDDKWAGKVAMQSVTRHPEGMMGTYYLAALKRALGEARWVAFLRGLAEKVKPRPFECLLHMSHALARGEYGIAFPATLRKASMADAVEGGPVDVLYLKDLPSLAILRTIALTRHGRNPNTAELFFDFALSSEWQREMGEKLEGMVPARPGTKTNYWVAMPLTSGLLFYPTREEVDRFGELVEIYRSVGLG